jgi:hypothetical protein
MQLKHIPHFGLVAGQDYDSLPLWHEAKSTLNSRFGASPDGWKKYLLVGNKAGTRVIPLKGIFYDFSLGRRGQLRVMTGLALGNHFFQRPRRAKVPNNPVLRSPTERRRDPASLDQTAQNHPDRTLASDVSKIGGSKRASQSALGKTDARQHQIRGFSVY